MSPEVLRWILGVLLFAHGVGHLLFMPVLNGAMRLEASGDSWLLTGLLGDGAARVLATVAAGIALAAFVAAAYGAIAQLPAWRPLVVGGAVVSLAVIVAMWGGLLASPAFFALAFDVLALVALVLLRWPSAEALGA